MNQDQLKQAVARAAVAEILPRIDKNSIIGVGTGSTANFFIDALAEYKYDFAGAVASSEATAERLRGHGIEVHDLNNARPAPSYTLFNLRLSAEQQHGPWTFGQLVRVDNLFDRKHVGSVIVGESNQRYYEPGLERSLYAGVNASYRF